MTRIKYPNPSFFRARDNMDWKAQGENLKEIGTIIGGMIKEADWKGFFSRQGANLKSDLERVKSEAETFASMSNKERLDIILHGEKRLGKLYRDKDMATVRREWRGIRDTGVDFYEWLRMWGMLLATFSKILSRRSMRRSTTAG